MMENPLQTNPAIFKILNEKASMHLDVLEKTRDTFQTLKKLLQTTINDLKISVIKNDRRIVVELSEKGPYETEFRIASDTIIFILHTNIFIFEQDHILRKTSYLHNDPYNGHCGMISVYNFLSDSFTFNRSNDIGYLISRIFINKDLHFYVEGKRQIGFLFNDFENAVISEKTLKSVLDSIILFCLDFDMYIPPFDTVNQVTVQEIINASLASSVITGKRLGFRLQSETDRLE